MTEQQARSSYRVRQMIYKVNGGRSKMVVDQGIVKAWNYVKFVYLDHLIVPGKMDIGQD